MREKANWFQKEKEGNCGTAGGNGTGGTGNAGTSWRHTRENQNKGKTPPTTVLYVPATPDGILAKRIQEKDLVFSDLHGLGWTKVVERGGTKVKDIITNKYPWAEVSCQRQDCLLCR